MAEYTPTTSQIHNAYVNRYQNDQRAQADAAFNRWLAAHDRDVKADALREAAKAADAMWPFGIHSPPSWLRARADVLDGGRG